MSEPTVRFADFYRGVWGRPAFRWQERLAAQVLESGLWPDVIDLPTGAGKTSALDIALYSLALRPDVFPRRVFFVVDRRVVVDQVSGYATQLVDRLRGSDDPAVKLIRDRIREMSGSTDDGDLLGVQALRGGVPLGNEWARWPDKPSVLASTIDQFGSRLLFRGYGVSQGMWPIHAGLAGNDCLVLLDEVHLAVPFGQTLRAVAEANQVAQVLPRRWKVVEMSATPRAEAGATVFQLEDADRDPRREPELAQRVTARKEARLMQIGDKREAPDVAFARTIGGLVETMAPGVVGVVVNRVATARSTAQALRDAGVPVVLLTGRMRPFDRDETVGRVQAAADPDRETAGETLVVVATQCIEVGADLSFDSLVSEVAPLDSLRQRFGRLDRRGRAAAHGTPAQAVVVGVQSTLTDKRPDPVYGTTATATWTALSDTFGDRIFDVGPCSDDLRLLEDHDGLTAPRSDAPLLLPTHVRAFVQTYPRPVADVDPAPFLHGFDEADREVSVIWRADLGTFSHSARLPAEVVADALRILPPSTSEALSVPLSALRAWLRQEAVEPVVADTTTTVEAAPDGQRVRDRATHEERDVFRWRGANSDETDYVAPRDIRPGDVVIVPSVYGGLDESSNWSPGSSIPVRDIAEISSMRKVARLHPAVRDGEQPRPGGDDDELLSAISTELALTRVERYVAWDESVHGPGEFFVLVEPRPSLVALDGSDDVNSFTGHVVHLDDHLAGVGAMAEAMATRCGLPPPVVADLRLAGELHDLGKADPRFQRYLHGDELSAARHPFPLAKGLRPTSAAQRRRARAWAGYPDHMRHELLSVAMIEDVDALRARAHDWELVVHLVATHHGFCRPLPILPDDPQPLHARHMVGGVEVSATTDLPSLRGTAAVSRFWTLVERYGWHGLAWLEATFRLADHRRSELETSNRRGDGHGK